MIKRCKKNKMWCYDTESLVSKKQFHKMCENIINNLTKDEEWFFKDKRYEIKSKLKNKEIINYLYPTDFLFLSDDFHSEIPNKNYFLFNIDLFLNKDDHECYNGNSFCVSFRITRDNSLCSLMSGEERILKAEVSVCDNFNRNELKMSCNLIHATTHKIIINAMYDYIKTYYENYGTTFNHELPKKEDKQ